MAFTTTEVLWDAIGTSREYLAKLTVPCTKWDLPPAHSMGKCLSCENGEMGEISLQKVLSSIRIVVPTIERRLERQISQIGASRAAAVQSFKARKHFNRTLPMNQLPFEIFIMIVEILLQDELFQGSYHKDLGRLRLHLDTPAVEKLVMSPESSNGEDLNVLLQAVTTFIGRAGEIVSRLRCIHLNIEATELLGWVTINTGVDSRNQTFTLESIFGPPAEWTAWVQDHILSSLSDKAEVELVLKGTISTDVISRIDCVQSIRSLKISATGMPHRTLEYLGRPVAARDISGSSNQYWPFSSVTSMTFEGDDCDLDAILSTLKGRFGTSDAHTSGGVPKDQLSDRQP
ncbi:hypothetical protein FS837_004289 [Tulasnella sp. UAMH 9824]|nr:hypothetical protein FS837_004289 [Tulasnella sp. UAMH 9824]